MHASTNKHGDDGRAQAGRSLTSKGIRRRFLGHPTPKPSTPMVMKAFK